MRLLKICTQAKSFARKDLSFSLKALMRIDSVYVSVIRYTVIDTYDGYVNYEHVYFLYL